MPQPTDPCADHECDGCPVCRAGFCCGESVLDRNLPAQGSWPGPLHAPLGEQTLNPSGKLICHACGFSSHVLGPHLRTHNLDAASYRSTFGLAVGAPMISPSERERRAQQRPPGAGKGKPPTLTTEQRRVLTANREARLQTQQRGRHDPEQQAEWARMNDHSRPEYRVAARKGRRQFDPGHECPECGALICTWTGRASGTSTQRVLCGERDCLRAARSRAAAIANRRRWE